MKKRQPMATSDFYCTICGNKGIPVMRPGNKYREAGHLKRLFCLFCEIETNHCEIRPVGHYTYRDFTFEFENNNFDDEGNRVLPYGEFRATMHNKGVELP